MTSSSVANWLTFASVVIGGVAIWWQISVGNEQDQLADQRNWQEVVVYTILRKEKGGLTFEEIRSKYIEAAQQVPRDIPKPELSNETLDRILLGLMKDQMVFFTTTNKYIFDTGVQNPRFEKTFDNQTGKYAILNLLAEEGGEYDAKSLQAKMMKEPHKLSYEEFNVLIAELLAANHVLVDGDQMLWNRAYLPHDMLVIPAIDPRKHHAPASAADESTE